MAWIQIVLTAFLLSWILQTSFSSHDMDVCRQSNRFFCTVSMQCISKNLVCNGYNNCVKGEDESPPACDMDACRQYGRFFCNVSMQCIRKSYVCDGESDCVNGEDETPPACDMDVCHQNGSFFCNVAMQCLSKYRVCDGDNDCANGDDETTPACALKRWCVSEWSLGEGCLGECKPGYFGKYCEKTCSKECFNESCHSSSGICQNCTPGYFGKYCQPCSGKCVNRLCNNSRGICKEFIFGYFGKHCEKTCSNKCTNDICNRSSGVCKDCTPGYFGKNCEKTCSNECTNGICNRSSGICKDCSRTFLENCSLQCGQGCREKYRSPQCDRQSGKCLNGCSLNYYGNYCNVSCMNCKRNSSVVLCDNNGVCLYGCENGYWDKKCSSKCSANCDDDAYGTRCNSSTGECLNGCTPGWSGIFCEDVSSLHTTTTELAEKGNVNSFKTTLIVISAIFAVVVAVVGIICFVWARKRFIRQQNECMKPGRVNPIGVPPRQHYSRSWRQQSSNVYADINEDTMEQFQMEQNSPDHYDEVIDTKYDRDIGIVPSKEFTDDNSSLRIVTVSESNDELERSDESKSWRSATHSYSDLDHACNTNNMNGVNRRRSVVESNRSIELVCTKDHMDLEALCQTNNAEVQRNPAARDNEEAEEIFGDLGQFQVDYIHAITREECELLDNESDHQTVESSL